MLKEEKHRWPLQRLLFPQDEPSHTHSKYSMFSFCSTSGEKRRKWVIPFHQPNYLDKSILFQIISLLQWLCPSKFSACVCVWRHACPWLSNLGNNRMKPNYKGLPVCEEIHKERLQSKPNGIQKSTVNVFWQAHSLKAQPKNWRVGGTSSYIWDI